MTKNGLTAFYREASDTLRRTKQCVQKKMEEAGIEGDEAAADITDEAGAEAAVKAAVEAALKEAGDAASAAAAAVSNAISGNDIQQ